MTRKPELTLLYRIARRYYIDKLSQSEIAEMENISRSQISRLLDRAEELGVVTISVQMPADPELAALADAVKRGLGLADLVIAPMENGRGDKERTQEAIATAAAGYLGKALRGAKTVGLGWGRTMYQTSLLLSYRSGFDDVMFVPLVGISGATNPCLQINTIVDRVAEKHHAQSYFVGVPAFRERSIETSGLDEARIRKLEDYWESLDAAVLGLGAAPHGEGSLFVSEIDPAYAEQVVDSGAVGDILSQYFLPDGSVFAFDAAYRQVAFDIRRLSSVKKVICLAGGEDKLAGILAGARKRYFSVLVTDSVTARAIYDILRKEGAIQSI